MSIIHYLIKGVAMYFKDLSKDEKLHLKSQEIFTLSHFKEVAEYQAMWRKDSPGFEPCYQCKDIAQKLGLAV